MGNLFFFLVIKKKKRKERQKELSTERKMTKTLGTNWEYAKRTTRAKPCGTMQRTLQARGPVVVLALLITACVMESKLSPLSGPQFSWLQMRGKIISTVLFCSSEPMISYELLIVTQAYKCRNLLTPGYKCKYNKVREEQKVKVLMATRIHSSLALLKGLLTGWWITSKSSYCAGIVRDSLRGVPQRQD